MSARKRTATPSRKAVKRVDEKKSLEVVCRLRPYDGIEPCAVVLDEEHVKLVAPSNVLQRNGQPTPDVVYRLGYVFDDTDGQRAVFDRTATDLIENFIRGRNSLLFTYGITGSGKTYTMTGGNSETTAGILPRCLDVIFNSLPNRVDRCVFVSDGRNGFEVRSEFEAAIARRRLEARPLSDRNFELVNRYVERKRVSGANDDLLCAVFVSYVEVYNDMCYDLLEEPSLSRDGNRVMSSKDLRLGVNNVVYADDVTEVEVDSSDEALELFYKGQERRRVGDTLLNKQSSRSHSIFNIRLVMAPCRLDAFHPESDPSLLHVSQLSLVDLAGSERTKRTGNEGTRLVETGKINQSLLVLRQCFERLRENQRTCGAPAPVPYRDSKLTHLFKNFFEGSGRVRMIICLNPRPLDYAENLGVMTFAELSQTIEITVGPEVALCAGDGLPISRRDFIKWTSEIDSIPKPVPVCLFSSPASLELSSSSDTETIARLRVHFQNNSRARAAYLEQYERKESEFDSQLKRALCLLDIHDGRIKDLECERDELERALSSLIAQLKQSRRENQALRQRIGRYEADENEKATHEEELRRRERSYQEQLRKKEKTLHQVREIFEKPSSAIRKQQTASTECVNVVGCTGQNEPSTSKGIMKSAVAGSGNGHIQHAATEQLPYHGHIPRRMGPQVAARAGFYNARYHRRSKSANDRVVDHQPRNRIPEGTVMQPRIPRNAKSTTKLDINDLRRSSEYLLTHQKVDQSGNLTTQLVKGDCIPTAGGGTAVRFNDVECLSHESPTTVV